MLPPRSLDSILTLEAVQPVQFQVIWKGMSRTTPEWRLLVAMIDQAAADLRYFRHRRNARSKRLYADARDWVLSNDRSHAFAFASICDQLGLALSSVRTSLVDVPDRPQPAHHSRSAA
jgi:hypothetical protein